jgi:hypothetical protein
MKQHRDVKSFLTDLCEVVKNLYPLVNILQTKKYEHKNILLSVQKQAAIIYLHIYCSYIISVSLFWKTITFNFCFAHTVFIPSFYVTEFEASGTCLHRVLLYLHTLWPLLVIQVPKMKTSHQANFAHFTGTLYMIEVGESHIFCRVGRQLPHPAPFWELRILIYLKSHNSTCIRKYFLLLLSVCVCVCVYNLFKCQVPKYKNAQDFCN